LIQRQLLAQQNAAAELVASERSHISVFSNPKILIAVWDHSENEVAVIWATI